MVRVLSLIVIALTMSSCSSLTSFLEEAATGDLDDRRGAMASLEAIVMDLGDSDIDVSRRLHIDAFLRQRFERSPAGEWAEPDSVIRSQLLSIAVQGEFACAEELLRIGAQDDSSQLVRIIAVQHIRDYDVRPFRELLLDRVANDPERKVKLEAVKSIGWARPPAEETAEWAVPLMRLFLDQTADSSLRDQAYRAAVRVLGEDIPPTEIDRWQERLDEMSTRP